MNRSLWVSLVFLAGALSGCESLREFQIAGGGVEYWEPKLDGHVEAAGGGLSSTKVELDETLDLDRENAWRFRGRFRFFDADLVFSYLDYDSSGRRTLTEPLAFNGVSFPSGTDLASDFELSLLTGQLRFPLTAVGPVVVGGIAGVDRLAAETELAGGGQAIDDGFTAYFPVAGLTALFQLPLGEGGSTSLFVDGELSGFVLEFFDVEGVFVDAAVQAGLQLDFFKVGGGYRWLDIDLEENDQSEVDAKLRGPFIFGELTF